MIFKIAEKTFEYEPLPQWKAMLERQYKDFLVKGIPDEVIKISEDRVEANRSIMRHRSYKSLPEELEMGSLQIAIIDLLRPFGNLLIHSAVVEVDGRAYAFSGHSGVGKSTQCGLWLKHFGERAVILNGDKSFFHAPSTALIADSNKEGKEEHASGETRAGKKNPSWIVYGTPWKGKENIGINGSAPLAGVIFLDQGPENKIRKLSKGEEVQLLMKQTYLPRTADEMDQHLKQLEEFVNEVPAYFLSCTISDEAVVMAYDAINVAELY